MPHHGGLSFASTQSAAHHHRVGGSQRLGQGRNGVGRNTAISFRNGGKHRLGDGIHQQRVHTLRHCRAEQSHAAAQGATGAEQRRTGHAVAAADGEQGAVGTLVAVRYTARQMCRHVFLGCDDGCHTNSSIEKMPHGYPPCGISTINRPFRAWRAQASRPREPHGRYPSEPAWADRRTERPARGRPA